jgi:alpha-N-arabinofuranosidase
MAKKFKVFIELYELLFSLLFLNIPVSLFGQSTESMLDYKDYISPYTTASFAQPDITCRNPVIPGFYSDPSICKVGDDYYLVTSTFEYFPGVPVFHSKDLVNWEQIGHCIDRSDQLPMGVNIFAASIRYHNGTFYMITTNFGGKGGNFYVTARNPAGPWSDPVWVDIRGIDPDLFFDEDGKAYVITSLFTLCEIDLKTGTLLDEGQKIWYGAGGSALEGPHIYKKDGYYYLMAAEGGTAEGHSVTIARSLHIKGPYINNPANPILTHANAAGQLCVLHGVGHADMVQASDKSWWMVFHAYRMTGFTGVHHTLGRETCLTPVCWPGNGWPVVNGNGTVPIEMDCKTLPLKPFPPKADKTDFEHPVLGLEWNYIQLPETKNYSLDKRKGFFSLRGSSLVIGEEGSPTFAGRRLQDMQFTATAQLEFDPRKENEEAGISLVNNGTHFDLTIMKQGNERYVWIKLLFGTTIYKSDKMLLKPGPVKLRVIGEKDKYIFSYAQGNDEFKKIDSVVSTYLSSETVGGFTGVYVGLYATGNGTPCTTDTYYDWFEYQKMK